MVPALVLILITIGFVIVVARMVNPGPTRIASSVRLARGKRTVGRRISRSSDSHRKRPRPKTQRPRPEARPEGKFIASWRLLLAIVVLAVGAAVAALLALRSIFGLLEGLVS